jgi:hypothetical protein
VWSGERRNGFRERSETRRDKKITDKNEKASNETISLLAMMGRDKSNKSGAMKAGGWLVNDCERSECGEIEAEVKGWKNRFGDGSIGWAITAAKEYESSCSAWAASGGRRWRRKKVGLEKFVKSAKCDDGERFEGNH